MRAIFDLFLDGFHGQKIVILAEKTSIYPHYLSYKHLILWITRSPIPHYTTKSVANTVEKTIIQKTRYFISWIRKWGNSIYKITACFPAYVLASHFYL